ncbi:MAG TPA: DUF6084 family protein [Alloacidobacterium sp.]|nr:DUF6084 family protein [Alloacidobacterium sp.]
MPDLSFKVEDATVVPYAVAPTLALRLRITNADSDQPIHTVALRCQIQLEVSRRRYTAEEQAKMRDLFGEPERWSQTLRSLLWTHVSVVVPSFQGSTLTDLPIHCTFDFNVAATKYFEGLTDGEIPLHLMFSGTVFYADSEDVLQVAPISWTQEAKFRLPVKVWRDMMDAYYPNNVWLNLRRDVFDRLYQYKTQRGIPTWEQALESMLSVEEVVGR